MLGIERRRLIEDAADILPAMVGIRRQLHRRPEVGLALPVTQATVAEDLSSQHLPVRLGTAGVGWIMSAIETGRPGPDLVLRADMDALPLSEATGLAFSSEIAGVMHACGHDLHMAMLLGAARLIRERRGSLSGRVILMFQPGEEGHGGAQAMLDEGCLADVSDSASSFALHVFSRYPSGKLMIRAGPIMAASDTILLTVTGRGGHASAPHLATDAITIAAEIVTSLQLMITRRFDPFDPVVLTISTISSGTRPSIIAATVEMTGTMRTFTRGSRELMHTSVRRVVQGICDAHGATFDLEIEPGYPVTWNDPDTTELVIAAAREGLATDPVEMLASPVMAAEDFSLVLARHRGAMGFLGAAPDGSSGPDSPMNHSSQVIFDEACMAAGAAILAAVAMRSLSAGT